MYRRSRYWSRSVWECSGQCGCQIPPSSTTNTEEDNVTIARICKAAVAIRKALSKKLANVKDLQTFSRSGRALDVQATEDQGQCFSSTSWMQFPLWDISFNDCIDDGQQQSTGLLDGFYGRPSYPLPMGDTYSSINVPSRSGGCTSKILAPTRQAQSILALHQNISLQFLEWAREQRLSKEIVDEKTCHWLKRDFVE